MSRAKGHTAWFFCFCLVSVCCPAMLADPPRHRRDTLAARHFPMKVGDKWIYAFDKEEVTFEVLRTETDDDGTLFVVRRMVGRTPVEFKIEVAEDGVYIHQEGRKEFRPPLRQFAFFARTEDEWKWKGIADRKHEEEKFTHLGMQKVTVPAGEYSAIGVHQLNPDGAQHATFWLFEGIGVVKISGKTDLAVDDVEGTPVVFEWKLKRYEPKEKQ
jgi:hypothetical protein